MTTVELPEPPARRRGALSDPAGRATAAAGALLVGGLALAVGDAGGTIVASPASPTGSTCSWCWRCVWLRS